MSTSDKKFNVIVIICILITVLLVFISLFTGRYPLSIAKVFSILKSGINNNTNGILSLEHTLIWQIRMPRIILSLLVGSALAVSGGALQGVFRNPLVDSGMLGVSSGAGFGACIAIILFDSIWTIYIFAFVFGIIAVALSYSLGRIYKSAPTIMLVLGGVIVSSIFSALISFVKYMADPYQELSEITFWLMGSLAKANYRDLSLASIPILIGVIGIIAIRWRLNILSLGDSEAKSLGINTTLYRTIIIICTTLATAGSVCISGTIGWIGLVIPHMARLIIGNDNKKLIPICVFMGGSYLLLVDNIARTITGSELPIGIITAIIGGPIYILILKRKGASQW